jgi:hypothetical protein
MNNAPNCLIKLKLKPPPILPSNMNESELLINHKYTIPQLKTIAKMFSLKISGTKEELTTRIYDYMYFYKYVIKIQRVFRKKMSAKYRSIIKFRDTVNDADFLTMEKMKDIQKSQFFSFKDEDGFIYGFDAMSFYQLVFVNKITTNPYTRSEIQTETINSFNQLIRISTCLKVPLNTTIEKDEITPIQQHELRVVALFHTINSLGNYADLRWFLDLDIYRLLKFFKELNDIWSFRSQISETIKQTICPPSGNPFRHIHFFRFNYDSNLFLVRQELLTVLERMVTSGVDKDSQTLGSYYVLCALTLVSHDAAIALPWLYESVQYYY